MCGTTRENHKGYTHAYVSPYDSDQALRSVPQTPQPPSAKRSLGADLTEPQIKQRLTTTDPLLRVLLVRKGLITMEEIDQVENEFLTYGFVVAEMGMPAQAVPGE